MTANEFQFISAHFLSLWLNLDHLQLSTSTNGIVKILIALTIFLTRQTVRAPKLHFQMPSLPARSNADVGNRYNRHRYTSDFISVHSQFNVNETRVIDSSNSRHMDPL